VLNLEALYATNNTVGSHRLEVREHSFLSNPQYPQELKVGYSAVCLGGRGDMGGGRGALDGAGWSCYRAAAAAAAAAVAAAAAAAR
jgi:hypothetical protein